MLCLFAIAVCILAYNDMQDTISVLSYVVCAFLIVYVGSWFYVSRSN